MVQPHVHSTDDVLGLRALIQSKAFEIASKWCRPFITPSGLPSTLYVNNLTGSDDTGDGSISSPFASLYGALIKIGKTNNNPIEVQLLNTGVPYDLDKGLPEVTNVEVRGQVAYPDPTRSITAVTYQNDTEGVQFTVDGSLLANDALAGRMARLKGAGSFVWVAISRNVGNEIYGTLVSSGGWPLNNATTTINGEDFDIVSMPEVNISPPQGIYTLASYLLMFQYIRVTGSVWYVEATSHVSLINCDIRNEFINTVTGATFYVGSTVSQGGVRFDQGSRGLFVSVVMTGVDASGNLLVGNNRQYIYVRNGSNLEVAAGGGIFRNLRGVDLYGGVLSGGVDPGLISWVFDAQVGAEISEGIRLSPDLNTDLFPDAWGPGSGWWGPPITGEVSSDYIITAQYGSNAVLSAGTNVVTGSGIDNAVSASGGDTPSSWNADGTTIEGGVPVYMPGHQFVGDIATNTEAGKLYVNEAPIAGDDAAVPPWEGKVPAVAGGSNGAQGYQVSGEVVIPAGLIDGVPSVGDVLYVAEAAGVPADKGRWSTSKPTDSGDLQHHVGTVLEVITGAPNEYRVLLTPNSLTIEVA